MYDNFCGDTFVPIEPDTVIEGLEQEFPEEWLRQVTIRRKKSDKHVVEKKHGFLDMLAEVGLRNSPWTAR